MREQPEQQVRPQESKARDRRYQPEFAHAINIIHDSEAGQYR